MDILSHLAPSLVGAVAIFFTSFMLWMLLKPWHGPDIKPLPDEEGLASSLETLNIPPGFYMWPHGAPGETGQAASMKDRMANGPWGTINILAKAPNFPRNLAGTFLVYFCTMLSTALVVSMGAKPDSGFGDLFWPCMLVAGTVFCLGPLPVGFFHGKSTRYLVTDVIDGLVFAAIGSVILVAMWPSAS